MIIKFITSRMSRYQNLHNTNSIVISNEVAREEEEAGIQYTTYIN